MSKRSVLLALHEPKPYTPAPESLTCFLHQRISKNPISKRSEAAKMHKEPKASGIRAYLVEGLGFSDEGWGFGVERNALGCSGLGLGVSLRGLGFENCRVPAESHCSSSAKPTLDPKP